LAKTHGDILLKNYREGAKQRGWQETKRREGAEIGRAQSFVTTLSRGDDSTKGRRKSYGEDIGGGVRRRT